MKLCTNWNEVTIKQFAELSKLKVEDTLEYNLSLVSLMSGKDARDIDISLLPEMVKKVQFVNELPTKKLLPSMLRVNGKRYRVNLNVSELTGGGYIDLKTLTKEEDKIVDNLHLILTCFIKPLKRTWYGILVEKKVSPQEQIEIANEFREYMSVGIAYPLAVFFCELYPNLILGIQQYLLKKANQEMKVLERQVNKLKKKHTMITGGGK